MTVLDPSTVPRAAAPGRSVSRPVNGLMALTGCRAEGESAGGGKNGTKSEKPCGNPALFLERPLMRRREGKRLVSRRPPKLAGVSAEQPSPSAEVGRLVAVSAYPFGGCRYVRGVIRAGDVCDEFAPHRSGPRSASS